MIGVASVNVSVVIRIVEMTHIFIVARRFLQRGCLGPVLLFLGAGRVAGHAHWQERGD